MSFVVLSKDPLKESDSILKTLNHCGLARLLSKNPVERYFEVDQSFFELLLGFHVSPGRFGVNYPLSVHRIVSERVLGRLRVPVRVGL